jgi:uncharacterized protein
VSERLPSREQALRILRQSGCRGNVVNHCEAVAELAVEMGRSCRKKGLNVDLKLIEVGALLHDVGRSRTHSVHHAVVGARIASTYGLPDRVLSIIKRHVGGGITAAEARRLGWPGDVYVPETLEEKIVSYADKLIEGSRRVPIEKTMGNLAKELPPPAVERVRRLHDEMMALIGDCPCPP